MNALRKHLRECRVRFRIPVRPVLLVPALALIAACEADEGPIWTLVWEDEFEGAAGQLPDPQRWTFDIGGHGWGNAQLEYNTDRAENVSLDGNGNLAIVARRESYQGNGYTSGRIKTQGRFEQAYGRFEARIRLPVGAGIWPAFWMLGHDIDAVGWPECGEIDIMEYRGQEPGVIHGSLHGPGHSGGQAVTRRHALPDGRFDTDFHVFGIEWDSESISWFVDGERYNVVRSGDVSGRWAYDHPFFLLLNVAVGGNFIGPPNDATVFPQTMLVDWVRVYERAG